MDINKLAGVVLVLGITGGGVATAVRGALRLVRERDTFDSTGSRVSYEDSPQLFWLHLAGFIGLGLFCLAFGLSMSLELLTR